MKIDDTNSLHREGDMAKLVTVGGHTFTLRYGYYSELDRKSGALLPLLPDFEKDPLYTEEGQPLVTGVQDACEHYRPQDDSAGDGWCADCAYYSSEAIEIAVCRCHARKKEKVEKMSGQK